MLRLRTAVQRKVMWMNGVRIDSRLWRKRRVVRLGLGFKASFDLKYGDDAF